MGPKKKGGGKGGAGVIIDGVDTTQMTREQLEIFCLRIKEENEREREERNFFQLERDKIRTFWEITRTELDELKAALRNKDRQIEEAAEKNDEELRFYKQKVKYLQFEHQNHLTESKAEALVSLKMAQDDYAQQERELLRDKTELKKHSREMELSNQDQIKSLKLQQSEEISKIRNEFNTKAQQLEQKYEKKFTDLKNELNLKHNMEMTEVEERKNNQITELIKHHENVFTEMKNYYNDITLNNLALISSLKDQMDILRKQNERMAKAVADVTAENKGLIEPLRKAEEDVQEYKKMLHNYEKDKLALSNTKAKLYAVQKDFQNLQWENNALELRFDKLQAEKDELSKRFVNAVMEVQQKTGLKNILLQKRIKALTEQNEYQEAVLGELPTDSKTVVQNKHLEEILSKKNALIQDLQYELARVCKAHDDMLETYEDKLQEYGIPISELGFVPLRIVQYGQNAQAKGPAGLVSKNK